MTETKLKVPGHCIQAARFAIVSNPGTLFERIEAMSGTVQSAREALGDHSQDDPCELFHVRHDGTLTQDETQARP